MISFLHQVCAGFHIQFCDVVDFEVIQGHHMSKGPQILNYYPVKYDYQQVEQERSKL